MKKNVSGIILYKDLIEGKNVKYLNISMRAHCLLYCKFVICKNVLVRLF